MRCNCESLVCPMPHADRSRVSKEFSDWKSCSNEAEDQFRVMYIGAVCRGCYEGTPQEYRMPLRKRVKYSRGHLRQNPSAEDGPFRFVTWLNDAAGYGGRWIITWSDEVVSMDVLQLAYSRGYEAGRRRLLDHNPADFHLKDGSSPDLRLVTVWYEGYQRGSTERNGGLRENPVSTQTGIVLVSVGGLLALYLGYQAYRNNLENQILASENARKGGSAGTYPYKGFTIRVRPVTTEWCILGGSWVAVISSKETIYCADSANGALIDAKGAIDSGRAT